MKKDEELALASKEAEQVLVSNRRRFMGFLLRRTGNESVAEELLQGALARALEKGIPRLQGRRVVVWFYSVLSNALAGYHRHQLVEARALSREAREGAGGVLAPELRGNICTCMHESLSMLKPEYAEVVRQVDLEEQSVAKVAQAMGITANNATVRLHRARHALKKQMERNCGACAVQGCLDCACGDPAPALTYERRTLSAGEQS